jgi:hypothetical protein
MNRPIIRLLVPALAVLVASAAGCKKQEAEAPPAAGNAPALQQSPAPAASTAPTASTTDSQLAESQKALAARQYDTAAEALIALQRTKLTDQQAAAAAAQMRQLQKSVAAGLASGDPRARAAAEKLRGSEMNR